MIVRTMKKQHLIQKKDPQHNQLWEWEETSELREYIKKYGKTN